MSKFNLPFSLPKMPAMPKMPKMPKMPGKDARLPVDLKMPDQIEVPKFLQKAFKLDIRMSETSRYFSGGVFERAMQTLDKSTLLIIGVSWLAAMLMMGVAFISSKEAAALKLKAETARALDPVLPKINRLPLTKDQYEPLVARLKKQFPLISFEITTKPTLQIKSNDGGEFITWLNAVSYTDSMISTVRWTMTFLCVGAECPGDTVMSAELTAESINIANPERN